MQRTAVRPILTSTEPGANLVKSRSSSTGRSSCGLRPSARGRRSVIPSTSYPPRQPRQGYRRQPSPPTQATSRSIVGAKWVMTSRSAPQLAAVRPACLALRCCKDPFFLQAQGRLHEGQLDAFPQTAQLPCRPRVSGVAERSAPHFDPGGQGLDRVVRSRPVPARRAHLGCLAIADHPPVERPVGLLAHHQVPQAFGGINGEALAAEEVAHGHVQPLQVAPVVGMGVADHHRAQA